MTISTTSSNAPEPQVITDPDGADDAEYWSATFEGTHHDVEVSYIRLSTTRVDVGPPLHQHPYPEIILIRLGQALFTLGSERFVAVAGQTLVIPPGTPHTFRTLDAGRYESVAVHQNREFVSELLEPGAGALWPAVDPGAAAVSVRRTTHGSSGEVDGYDRTAGMHDSDRQAGRLRETE